MGSSSTPETDYDVVVVGGGIAGLMAAWQLREFRVLLLEHEDRAGGRIKSVEHAGYWANLGAHVFPHADSQMGRLAAELGLDVRQVKGSITAVGMGDRIVSPARVELLPFVLDLTLRERLSVVRAGLKVALGVRQINKIESTVPTNADGQRRRRLRLAKYRNDETFESYLGHLAGRAELVFDSVAHRAAADRHEISAGTALLCSAHVLGPKDAPGATARVVIGGTEQVVLSLSERLGDRIRLGAAVTRVADRGDHVDIDYERAGGVRQVTALAVVVATPAHVARRIIEDVPAALDQALGAITYGAFLSMAIFTDEAGPLKIDDLYAISTPGHEIDFLFNHAQILRDGTRLPGGSLMCYRGGPRAADLLAADDDTISATFLRSVYELVPELRGHVVATVVQRWPLGTVYAAPGRGAMQSTLESGFDHDRITLAGDYFDPLSGMEPAAQAAARAVQRTRRALSARTGSSQNSNRESHAR